MMSMNGTLTTLTKSNEGMKNLLKFTLLIWIIASCNSKSENVETIPPPDESDAVFVAHETSIPSDYDSLYRKAAVLMQTQQYSEAEKIYTSLLKIEDDKRNALAGLAGVQSITNRTLEAKKNYHRLLALDSDNYFGNLGIGSCYYELKEYKKAISHYKKARKSDPSTPEAYRGLAIAFEGLDELDSAAYYAETFLRLAPNTAHRAYMERIIRRE